MEQDLSEPLVSAETVVLDGDDIRIAAVTHTSLGPGPARQAVRHCVHAGDPLLHHPMLRQVVTRTVRALGITLGVLHIELRLTGLGPRVSDVQACLAGDLIPLLVQRATGIDLPRVAADLAAGGVPDLTPRRQRAAAIHFLYPDSGGRVEHLSVSAPDHDPFVERFVLTQRTGQYVNPAPSAGREDRLAHRVVLGTDAADCHRALDQAGPRLRVVVADDAKDGCARPERKSAHVVPHREARVLSPCCRAAYRR
ncbi:hypothetical protein ABZ705_12790 [Streptomyces sp. NPDC006984]|uniref:hypothetical protein n=1 Tax=Streptomyces sp. NPDC006984 TaxID=3155463 RepID=UPI0033FADC26